MVLLVWQPWLHPWWFSLTGASGLTGYACGGHRSSELVRAIQRGTGRCRVRHWFQRLKPLLFIPSFYCGRCHLFLQVTCFRTSWCLAGNEGRSAPKKSVLFTSLPYSIPSTSVFWGPFSPRAKETLSLAPANALKHTNKSCRTSSQVVSHTGCFFERGPSSPRILTNPSGTGSAFKGGSWLETKTCLKTWRIPG